MDDEQQTQQLLTLMAKLPFFSCLNQSELNELATLFTPRLIHAGQPLLNEGDDGDEMYLVMFGYLRAYKKTNDDNILQIGDLLSGDLIGEMALLTGDTRSASVIAIRDSLIYCLTAQAFQSFFHQRTNSLMQLFRYSLQRLNQSSAPKKGKARIFTLAPAGNNEQFSIHAELTRNTLSNYGTVKYLSTDNISSYLPALQLEKLKDIECRHELSAFVEKLYADYEYVVIELDLAQAAWNHYALTQVDEILFLANANSTELSNAVEAMSSTIPTLLQCSKTLLLFHPDLDNMQPRNTKRWLENSNFKAHHHIEKNNQQQLHRAIRTLLGQANALVLGGGGARGLAHIGAFQALTEAGITIDCIGGTSAGALVGSVLAMDISIDEIKARALEYLAKNKSIFDYTIPYASLLRGKGLTNTLKKAFTVELGCEDLLIRFFSVAADLKTYSPVLQTMGPLWKHLRASTSIPAIFPPINNDSGALLVDGGIINNLPVDYMQKFSNHSQTIAISLSNFDNFDVQDTNEGWISGWDILKKKLNPFYSKEELHYPHLSNIITESMSIAGRSHSRQMEKAANLTLHLNLSEYSILEFDKAQTIIQKGYIQTIEQLDRK